MNKFKKIPISFIFILIVSLSMQQLLVAKEAVNNDSTSLHKARSHLSIAFDKFNKADITAAKQNLEQASEWLNKANSHSKSDKVKREALKLASEIDSFRLTLSHSSVQPENTLVRFWHRVTSLIKRESEHLVHSYTESSTKNRTLKHLLDAKMQFYIAEHDLFVSHDLKYAKQELDNSINYLVKAESIASSELKTHIKRLITDINALIVLTNSSKESWKKDDLLQSLNKVTSILTTAESNATPINILKIKSIKHEIHNLEVEILKTNLKTRYDLIMTNFSHTINNI